MTKTQKIWMWIFVAMFAIPEILWSPVVNFLYSFFNPQVGGYPKLLRNNFLLDYQHENLLKTVIIIQIVGILSFFIFWFKNKNNIPSKKIFWIFYFLGLLICLVSLFVFYLVFMFSLNV